LIDTSLEDIKEENISIPSPSRPLEEIIYSPILDENRNRNINISNDNLNELFTPNSPIRILPGEYPIDNLLEFTPISTNSLSLYNK
jgi:hypothetical protein